MSLSALECGVENGFLTRVASQGDDLAEKIKDFLEKSMTLDQLAEAQRLAREWKAKGE